MLMSWMYVSTFVNIKIMQKLVVFFYHKQADSKLSDLDIIFPLNTCCIFTW